METEERELNYSKIDEVVKFKHEFVEEEQAEKSQGFCANALDCFLRMLGCVDEYDSIELKPIAICTSPIQFNLNIGCDHYFQMLKLWSSPGVNR